MQIITITTSQNIDIAYEQGGLGERIVASLIDTGIFLLILILVSTIFGNLEMGRTESIMVWCCYLGLYVFYDLVCEMSMNGQSVGKKVMKIRVISLDGSRPRFSQYLLRWLFRIVDFGITFGSLALIVSAISAKGQRVGDIVAGTALVRTEPRTNLTHVAFRQHEEGYIPVYPTASQLSEQDIELINEVINTYVKTGNSLLVYNMAKQIKDHLGLVNQPEMNDMRFLQTILKDYGSMVAQTDVL